MWNGLDVTGRGASSWVPGTEWNTEHGQFLYFFPTSEWNHNFDNSGSFYFILFCYCGGRGY